jgi:hypothetical protein
MWDQVGESAGRHGDSIEPLLGAAALVWCRTRHIQAMLQSTWHREGEVIRDSIDPRIWRRYRDRDRRSDRDRLEFVIHGPREEDLEMVLDSLERIHRDGARAFRLTVIDGKPTSPMPDWVRFVTSGESSYPRAARWLRDQSHEFDIGLLPLGKLRAGNGQVSDLSALEFVAMGLPVLASAAEPFEESDLVESRVGADDWASELAKILSQGESTPDQKARIEARESLMWQTRSAALTGSELVVRLSGLAH